MRRAMLGTEKEMATKVAGILGKKVGMTQLFDSKGDVRPVTVLQAGPCVVTQHKSATRDGYEAAQIGLVEFVKQSRLTKPAQGHLAKNNLPPVKFMREVPLEVEGSVPGPEGGYIVITKAKKPPRERRGFAGSATVDPLKAAKRAAKKA